MEIIKITSYDLRDIYKNALEYYWQDGLLFARFHIKFFIYEKS